MLWRASSSIAPNIEPTSWQDEDGDGINDNPWQPVYGWEDGDEVIIEPTRWYVDGDAWIADLSQIGKKRDIDDDDLLYDFLAALKINGQTQAIYRSSSLTIREMKIDYQSVFNKLYNAQALLAEIEWDVEIHFINNVIEGQARTSFPFSKFKMEIPSLFFILSVEDKIRLELDFSAQWNPKY